MNSFEGMLCSGNVVHSAAKTANFPLFVIVAASVALDSANARQVNRREKAYSDSLSTAECARWR